MTKRIRCLLVALSWVSVARVAVAAPVLDQSFVTSQTNLGASINDCCALIAQTFTAGVDGALTGVNVAVQGYSDQGRLNVAIRTVEAGDRRPLWRR